jgi:hypothetical protein
VIEDNPDAADSWRTLLKLLGHAMALHAPVARAWSRPAGSART